MKPQCKVKYTGAIPTASATFVLFSTVASQFAAQGLAHHGLRRLTVDLKHDQNITLNTYKSSDRGATWVQVSTESVAAPTYTTVRDYLVEMYDDFKLELVNGGTDQTVWVPDLLLGDSRVAYT